MSMSEASHPARLCAVTGDSVVCVSTSVGTGLVAIGTEQGHIGVWDLDRGLLIMVRVLFDVTNHTHINE